MNTALHFSSATPEWATPQAFFDELNEEFHFTLDVCATPENAKASNYYTEAQNGLVQDWKRDAIPYSGGAVWMNPPYGNPRYVCKTMCQRKNCLKSGKHNDKFVPGIWHWMQKAHNEALLNGLTVVCLVPARTDTKWWHQFVQGHAEIRFVKGRLKFGGHKNAAPFPSAVVIFRGAE